jgi:hypothetical protein
VAMLASLSKSSILISSPVSKFLMTNICSSCGSDTGWLINTGENSTVESAAQCVQSGQQASRPSSALQSPVHVSDSAGL